MKHTQAQCDKHLQKTYRKHSEAKDGEIWTCVCGQVWEHVCDESEGCYWVPQIVKPCDTRRTAKRTAVVE